MCDKTEQSYYIPRLDLVFDAERAKCGNGQVILLIYSVLNYNFTTAYLILLHTVAYI